MCKLSSSPKFLIKQCLRRGKREQIVSGNDLEAIGLLLLVSHVDLTNTRVELVSDIFGLREEKVRILILTTVKVYIYIYMFYPMLWCIRRVKIKFCAFTQTNQEQQICGITNCGSEPTLLDAWTVFLIWQIYIPTHNTHAWIQHTQKCTQWCLKAMW